MDKIEEAQLILESLGLDKRQSNRISGLTLLALANIKEDDSWSLATSPRLGVSKGIMQFIAENYNVVYAENSRESFRRQVLHFFIQHNIVEQNADDKTIPVNSSKNHYSLTEEFLEVLKLYGTPEWSVALESFIALGEDIRNKYLAVKEFELVPVLLPNGNKITLSSGLHNDLQKAIIEEFAPRFAQNAMLLYLGDTAQKDIVVEKEWLSKLGIPIDQHSKLPDVILYVEDKNWIYLIEAVTTHGPVSQKRINELEELFKGCKSGKVYVTAFPDMTIFKKYSNDIAWETEVWLMDLPDHMIHFNGDRFLGPRNK